jgi:putative hydrolase of HD superfamily
MERLATQIRFIRELDKLKRIQRQTWLTDASRRENSAEHSWHIAVAAMVLSEYAAGQDVDVGRVLRMLLVHDIVEIDAGDTFCYDREAVSRQAEQEQRAADRLFGLLPSDQAADLRALWEEFENRRTPEALLAHALDRLQPILNNYASQGKSWRAHGITRDQVRRRNRMVSEGAPALWHYIEDLLQEAVRRGFLAE